MATTLPTVANIERPIARPSAAIVSYNPAGDTGAAARGLASLGQQIVGVADAYQLAHERLVKARQAAQLTDVMGKATLKLGELELKYQRDQDYKTSPQRFQQDADMVRQQLTESIDDELVRGSFQQRYNELAIAKRLNVLTHAARQEGDYHRATLDGNLDVYATSAANARNVAERALVQAEATNAITALRQAGWITDVEAQTKSKGFFSKVDQAIVTRDMHSDPFGTAGRLVVDASYAAALDPVARERLIDSGFRRAETLERQREAEINKQRTEAAEEGLKNAWDALDRGQLTRARVEALRPIVSASQYHGLLSAMKNQAKKDTEDKRETFANLQRLLYPAGGGPPDIDAVEVAAYAAHAKGEIKDATLTSTLARARELSRSEGPRSPYERNRAYLVGALEPSQMTSDPAPRARQALAIRAFDDWFNEQKGSPPSEADIRRRADEILKQYQLIDMVGLANKTGGGFAGASPQQTLDRLAAQAQQLQADFTAKRISKSEFERRMADVNRARKAAERANDGKR